MPKVKNKYSSDGKKKSFKTFTANSISVTSTPIESLYKS